MGEIGHRALRSRKDDQIRRAQRIAGFDITEANPRFALEWIEVIEIRDVRQSDNGDVEVKIAPCLHGMAFLQADGVFLWNIDIVVVGNDTRDGNTCTSLQPIGSWLEQRNVA